MLISSPSPVAVLDANGIIGLAKGGVLGLSRRLFGAMVVPPAVVEEVKDAVSRAALATAIGDWIVVRTPTPASLARVTQAKGAADRDVIALALDQQLPIIVSGDAGLVTKAKRLGIPSVNAPGVIRLLAEAGIVSGARPHLDQMIAAGFGIATTDYNLILTSLGE